MSYLGIVPIALLVVAAVGDASRRVIPNALCAVLALTGMAVAAASGAEAALWTAAAACGVFLGGAALFAAGAMGGGDVKLAAAAATWMPAADVPVFLLLTSLSGGLLALVALGWGLAARRRAGQSPRAALAAATRVELPYGVAIAAGAIAVIVPGVVGGAA